MGSNKTSNQLRAITQDTVVAVDEGDILRPLKIVRDEYITRAGILDTLTYGDNRAAIKDTAARYRVIADSIQHLIGVENVASFVEAPAPVDQTEDITIDDGKQWAATLGGTAAPLQAAMSDMEHSFGALVNEAT